MRKLKNASFSQRRGNVNTEKQPSIMTFSLEVIMVLSDAAFMSVHTNYISGSTQTHTNTLRAALSQSVILTVKV